MTMLGAGAHRMTTTLRAKIRKLCHDRRGVAAIEFAFIAPILMIMYFVTMEAADAIETSKKVSRLSSMVGDLIAQQSEVNPAALDAITAIAKSTLQPYNRSEPTIVVTAIQMSTDATPKAQVFWSYGPGAEGKGKTTTVPASLKTKSAFLIRVTSTLSYRPFLTWAAGGKQAVGLTRVFDNITMSETYYLRPRVTSTITCPTC